MRPAKPSPAEPRASPAAEASRLVSGPSSPGLIMQIERRTRFLLLCWRAQLRSRRELARPLELPLDGPALLAVPRARRGHLQERRDGLGEERVEAGGPDVGRRIAGDGDLL